MRYHGPLFFIACFLFSGCSVVEVREAGSNKATPSHAKLVESRGTNGVCNLQAKMDEYLREKNLQVGENKDGLWVQTGVSEIPGVAGSPGWIFSRELAFRKASLQAQVKLARSFAMQNMMIAIEGVSAQASVDHQKIVFPEDIVARSHEILKSWSEPELDQALNDFGVHASPGDQIEAKRRLYLQCLKPKAIMDALADVSGCFALKTFELGDQANGGHVSIGAVIGYRKSYMEWISIVAKGGGAQNVSRANPGKTLTEVVPNDPKILFERFGVSVVADETGQICILAYGQSSPPITKGMSSTRIEQILDLAHQEAEAAAQNAISEFFNFKLSWQGQKSYDRFENKLATQGVLDSVKNEEDAVLNLMNLIDQESIATSSTALKGVTKFLEWQGNHPVYGFPIVGCVCLWTAESADSSLRFSAPVNRGSGQHEFVPKRAPPGIRASRGEDKPSGKVGGKEE